MRPVLVVIAVLSLLAGCARTQIQTYAKPASPERTFGGIKKIAVLPFDSATEGAGTKNLENVLTQRVMALRGFDLVKDPRYVSSLMKKLKLRNAETLEKEIVQKICQELQVDAVLVGSVYLFGEEEKSRITEISLFVSIIEGTNGDTVWSGSTFVRASTTWGEVFGLSEGPSVNEMAFDAVSKIIHEMNATFADARKAENKIIMSQAAVEVKEDEEEEAAGPEQETEDLLLKVKPK